LTVATRSHRGAFVQEERAGALACGAGAEVESFLESVVPCSACVFGSQGRFLDDASLLEKPWEISVSSSVRKREFVAGRIAASMALEKLGFSPSFLPRGERGEPIWPRGVTGSISHTGDLCLCLVALTEGCESVGVDIERVERVDPGLARRVMTCAERGELEGLKGESLVKRVASVFSAKEAYYKLQYPLTGRFVGFCEVEVSFCAGGEFWVVPLVEGLPRARGAHLLVDGVVVSVVWK